YDNTRSVRSKPPMSSPEERHYIRAGQEASCASLQTIQQGGGSQIATTDSTLHGGWPAGLRVIASQVEIGQRGDLGRAEPVDPRTGRPGRSLFTNNTGIEQPGLCGSR